MKQIESKFQEHSRSLSYLYKYKYDETVGHLFKCMFQEPAVIFKDFDFYKQERTFGAKNPILELNFRPINRTNSIALTNKAVVIVLPNYQLCVYENERISNKELPWTDGLENKQIIKNFQNTFYDQSFLEIFEFIF
jgi:hypothetical protein